MKHLIHYRDKAAVIDMPQGASSDYYAEVQRKFSLEHGALQRKPWESEFADMQSLYPDDTTPQGMPFAYDLCSSGMIVGLYIFQGETPGQVKAAKSWMRNTHDIVKLYAYRFQSVAFQIPEYKPEPTPS